LIGKRGELGKPGCRWVTDIKMGLKNVVRLRILVRWFRVGSMAGTFLTAEQLSVFKDDPAHGVVTGQYSTVSALHEAELEL
jgi:hypothetical protein